MTKLQRKWSPYQKRARRAACKKQLRAAVTPTHVLYEHSLPLQPFLDRLGIKREDLPYAMVIPWTR